MASGTDFISLQELEQTSKPSSYGPGASFDVPAPHKPAMGRQTPLPELYRSLTAEQIDSRITAARAMLGNDLVILGHHYQRDEIIKHADFRGDSFKLSQLAAARPEARYIVFCGVFFMAESADVLSRHDQAVILPNLTAGCSMADMANLTEVTVAWKAMSDHVGPSIVPVTYMNSSADLKAFCGEHGGIVCTSSNAAAVLTWAFARGQRVLFFPDEHLGRNTADRLGLSQSEVSVWDPRHVQGSTEVAREARLIVWKGFCSVHERFTVEQIERARVDYPGCTVIVHPECRREVVQAADASGSTEFIVERIETASPGTTFAIGTEVNLVNRLAREHAEITIFCLDPVVCPCSTMYRIHPAYLAWTLDNLVQGTVVNQVAVDPTTAGFARLALNRMLDVTTSYGGSRNVQPSVSELLVSAAS
jgi:quinolinate synthase